MPVISALNSGLRINNVGNTLNTGEISFGDFSGFFPVYASNSLVGTTGQTGQLVTGGAYITLNPATGPVGVQTLVAGEALTLSIEYNAQNQCRFDITPLGATSVQLTSPWVTVGAEHSVGVSYDTTSGLTVLSVDGASVQSILTYVVTSTSQLNARTVLGTNSGALSATPNFNGFIDQLAIFNTAPSSTLLNSMTNDPVSTNSALAGHLESQQVAFMSDMKNSGTAVAIANAATGNITLSSSVGGVQVGDTITDISSTSGNGSYIGTVGAISLSGNSLVLNVTNNSGASVTVGANDTLMANHLPTTSVTMIAALPQSTATITLANVTGIMAGDIISGFDIPPNTTVASIPTGSGSVVLSQPIGSTVVNTAETILFTHPSATSNVTTTYPSGASTSILVVPSAQGIQVGDVVIGSSTSGIPVYDHVIGINAAQTQVTLSQATNATTPGSTIPVTFVHSSEAIATNGTNITTSTSVLTVSGVVGNIQVGDIVMDTYDSTVGAAQVFINSATTPLTATVVTAVNALGTSVTLSGPALTTGILAGNGNGDQLTFTHTTSQQSTASASANASVLSLGSTVGIMTGDIVVDLTASANTRNAGNLTVTGVGPSNVTLSNTVPNAFTNDTLSFVHPPAVSANPATSSVPPATTGNSVTVPGYQLANTASNTLLLNNTNGIIVASQTTAGDFVYGPNVPVGDTVIGVSSTQITLAQPLTLNAGIGNSYTFVHQSAPNAQVVTLNTTQSVANGIGYQVGNTITINAPVTANTNVTATYTIANSDIGSTTAATAINVAKSFVNANPLLGAFALSTGPANGQITLVPLSGTSQVLPLVTVREVNQAGIDENTIANYYNFTNIKNAANSVTGASTTALTNYATNLSMATGNNAASLLDSSSASQTSVTSLSYAAPSSTGATPQLRGPVYAELSNLNGTTATYNLFVDGNMVTGGVLNTVGMTINVPTSQGTISNIIPASNGTISQVNNTNNGSISYQWASNTGLNNLTSPIGQLVLNLNSTSINSLNATVTNMSVNNVNFKDPVLNVPMLETAPLNSQVYTVKGTFFDQFNPVGAYGLTNSGTPWGQFTSQVALPFNDFSYTVTGAQNSDFKMVVENTLVPVTAVAQNANVAIDLFPNSMPGAWTTAKAMPFSMTINVPSNASGVTFTPSTGVTLSSSTSTTGHTITVSGTYSAPSGKGAVGTSAPMLGVLNATLTNEFNNGGQFSMDTVSLNGSAATGQSLYFGMGEANASGAYNISNLPAGSLVIKPFNNVAQVNPSTITVNDVLAVMSLAAGRGVPGGPGQAVGTTSNLLPSDFVSSDYNQDGQVTAADALNMLNYIVSVNKSSTPGFVYMSATGNALINTVESTTSVVTPAIAPIATNLSASGASLLTGDSSKVIDIVGVLPGNVVNY